MALGTLYLGNYGTIVYSGHAGFFSISSTIDMRGSVEIGFPLPISYEPSYCFPWLSSRDYSIFVFGATQRSSQNRALVAFVTF